MKKFYAIVAVSMIALLGSSAFAKSDLQIQLGYRGQNRSYNKIVDEGDLLNNNKFDLTKDKIYSNAFDISIENYNLFDINDVFSVGFMEGLSGYIGSINKLGDGDFGIGFIIGPAIGVKLADIVKFQATIGLAVHNNFETVFDTGDIDAELGFAAGLQAKFFPVATVSPLVGIRYTFTTTTGHEYRLRDIDHTSGRSNILDKDANTHAFVVYIGASINFGKKSQVTEQQSTEE